MKIALIGYQIQEKYHQGAIRNEDDDLFSYLKAKGLAIHREVWDDPSVQWAQYRAVVLKSPWDYHEKLPAFIAWAQSLVSQGITVLNPLEVVLWNSDKHYLRDIHARNLPTIPTHFLESADDLQEIPNYFVQWQTEKAVIKPSISAGAKNTLVLSVDDVPSLLPQLASWLKEGTYLLQPFVSQILDGEWSLVYFGGKFSHGLLKVPKANDFRVQHYLGGSVIYQEPAPELVAQADAFVKAFASETLYARVDGVLMNGTFHLMELELIEPYLFLNNEASRMESYYTALVGKLERFT